VKQGARSDFKRLTARESQPHLSSVFRALSNRVSKEGRQDGEITYEHSRCGSRSALSAEAHRHAVRKCVRFDAEGKLRSSANGVALLVLFAT
jgi:hypothetical protein